MMNIPSQLQEVLPIGYSYRIKNWTTFEGEPTHFESVILTNIYTEEEAQEWWHEFNIKSNTTMRVRATCPKTGKINSFKIYLRCLHQGRTEKFEKEVPSSKAVKRNTNCPAGMIVAIRRVIRYSRSKKRDPVDPVHPCEIQIRFVHNHPIRTADSLRFRPVSKESEKQILSLFKAGHSPSSALDVLKINLQIEHGPLYSEIISDRYHCPDRSYCYRLYNKHFGKDFISSVQKDMKNVLISKVSYYNKSFGEKCLDFGTSGTDHVVAVCTPLMKRSHSFIQSGDIVYVESYKCPANKEKCDHYVLLFNAHTSAGGVPLGALLTTSKSIDVLTVGFQLLNQLLPDKSFSGRGKLGPHAFLIEDSDDLKKALNCVWPDSDVIICIFRILQSMWQWLWNEKHNISKDHRLYLLYLLKTVLFASSVSEMTMKYQAVCSDEVTVHYPSYMCEIESLWQKHHLWSICFHHLPPLQDASNYYEAAVRTLKDKVLEQVRSFNIIQMLNYLVTQVDFYYKSKFQKLLKREIDHTFLSYFPDSIPPHIVNCIKQIAGNYYVVPSEDGKDRFHTIDAELNSCSCPNGINGMLCIHQHWVFMKTPTDMFKGEITDDNFKQKLLMVASGSSDKCDTTKLPNTLVINDIANDSGDITVKNSCSFPSTQIEENKVNHLNSSSSNDSSLPCAKVCSDKSHVVVYTIMSSPALVNSTKTFSSVPQVSPNSTILKSSPLISVNSNDSDLIEKSKSDVEDDVNENSESELNLRKMKALENFDKFCKRVKDGLKNQTEEFLPALEIMMKNIERKGSTADQIVSGLSFFGIVSAPSLEMKGKKRPASTNYTEELVPKVYGRQMATYERKGVQNTNKSELASKSPVTKS